MRTERNWVEARPLGRFIYWYLYKAEISGVAAPDLPAL
jgi:hypothetical protein